MLDIQTIRIEGNPGATGLMRNNGVDFGYARHALGDR